jgi:hypothetical protein
MACVTELRYATEMPLCATAATATRHSWARTTPLPSAQIPSPVRRAFNYTQEFNLTRFPSTVARDQEVDVPTQLGLGVRLLQAQAHLNNGVIHFCHTSEHPTNSRTFIYCSLLHHDRLRSFRWRNGVGISYDRQNLAGRESERSPHASLYKPGGLVDPWRVGSCFRTVWLVFHSRCGSIYIADDGTKIFQELLPSPTSPQRTPCPSPPGPPSEA